LKIKLGNKHEITQEESTDPGMVLHACDPSAQEAEAGGSQVQGQPELKQ
jgi:hypothetical protein